MSDTPDFSHPNTRAVRAACDRLGIQYVAHDPYGNFVEVQLMPPRYFVNAAAPFNDSAVNKICKDKDFAYRLLKDVVQMPRLAAYFYPFPENPAYAGYVREKSYEEIADAIVRGFALPVIVKMNSGSQGTNVFLCKDRTEVLAAVERVFDHTSATFDYVAVAQEYVPPATEYRAVVFRGKVVLLYEKDLTGATFAGNLSPLHHENAHALLVEDATRIGQVQEAIVGIFPKLPLEFGGIDLIEDTDGTLHVIELNTHPGFQYFVQDNGDEPLVAMYETILRELKEQG